VKPGTVSRHALLGTGAADALLRALPAGARSPAKPLVLDDASRLSATPVARLTGFVLARRWGARD